MRTLVLTGVSAALVAGLHLYPSFAAAAGDESPSPAAPAQSSIAAPADAATASDSTAPAATEDAAGDSGENASADEASNEEPKSWKDQWLPSVRLGGAISYGHDFNDPQPSFPNAQLGLYSSFDSPGFNVDLLQVELSGFRRFVGYSTKVDFGDLARVVGDDGNRDRDLIYTNPDSDWSVALQEGFVYVDVSRFVFNLGRFASPMGYEVVEPWGNANITRSRAWLEQPISFDGLSAAWKVFGVDFTVGAVNSVFKDDEYDQFQRFTDPANPGTYFGDIVDESDAEWGAIFAMGTKVLDAEISFAGFWTQVDEALDSGLLQVFSTEPTDKVLLNLVLARSFGRVSTALEGNFAYLDSTDKVVFLDEKQFGGSTSIDSSSTGNGAVYVGVTFLEKGSVNFRADYGVFSDSFRERSAKQWSVTTTLGWQFNDYIAFRVEHRYDGSDSDLRDLFVEDDGKFTSSVNTIHAQLVLTAKPL